MAFTEAIDPLVPGENDPAEFGDDEIRNFKTAINERMSQLATGWPDTDPLKINPDAIGDLATLVDVLANVDTLVAAFGAPHSLQLYRVTALMEYGGAYAFHRGVLVRESDGTLTLDDMTQDVGAGTITLSISGTTLVVRHNVVGQAITLRVKVERVI